MECPFCKHNPVSKHSSTTKGRLKYIKYVCPACEKTFVQRGALKRLPWQQRPIQLAVVLVGCAVAPLIALSSGLLKLLPTDSGEPTDAIVVLGRGENFRSQRVETVTELWQRDRAPQIFASGMNDAMPIVEMLKAEGIPSQALSGESCSESTEENAIFTAALLYPQGVRKIVLVTDSPHMLRSLLVFRSFGFTVIPRPSALPDDANFGFSTYLTVREYFTLASYALLGKLNLRSSTELKNPPTEVLNRIASWHCRVKG
jgi:uncharacterized SAM-binding protein YcdF (DUF218 family)